MVDLPANLVNAVQSQSAVLFLGSGASVGAKHPEGLRPPTGGQLRDLISERFLGGELKDRPLAEVAELSINESSLIDLQTYVRDIFAPFNPADFHRLMPTFRWHGIASTNLDMILEAVYSEAGSPLQELVPFTKNGQPIEAEMKRRTNGIQFLKLHGSISNYNDTETPFILATEQYVKYKKNRTRLFDRLQDWGGEFPIIFCGYSIADNNIQNILFDLFDLERKRPPFYVVLPNISEIESRYWTSRRVFPIRATFQEFLESLDTAIPKTNRSISPRLGGGTSTLRHHFRVSNVTESKAFLAFLQNDAWHIHSGMPVSPAQPKEFYRGYDQGWSAISADLDIPRAVTDSVLVDGVLLDEENSTSAEIFVLKGAAGNGKSIALKRAAWAAANDYGKLVLFARPGGTLRKEVLDELYGYTGIRTFLFVDHTALWAEDLQRLLEFARHRSIPLTVVTAEREAEWNVRCEALDRYVSREFPVRYLSEREIRDLLRKLEANDSLGLLADMSFEDRVRFFSEHAQRQLLVALHEATLGKPFEEIVADEFGRIIPIEARQLYLDVCSLNRLGTPVRAGLISRVAGISFADFQSRFFRPLEHIVLARHDPYIDDWVYTARHQRVAEMVFETELSDPEQRYDQLVRVMRGMNIDYSSDKQAFDQLVRGHAVKDAFKSQELGHRFYDVAMKIAGEEAYLYQQRAIFEMEHPGGSLNAADSYLERASEIDIHSKSIRHTRANLARRQALAAENPILRKQLRDKARARLSGLTGLDATQSYGFHTAAQLALDELNDLLGTADAADPLVQRQIVDLSHDVERFLQDGFQRAALNEHLLTVEAGYRTAMKQNALAQAALEQAFRANPRLDWIASRLAKSMVEAGDTGGAEQVLRKSLQENPSSKRTHFELARLLMKTGGNESSILGHLRRSFTNGDQNYEAQFWYARQLFLARRYPESEQVFRTLTNAEIAPRTRNEVRAIICQSNGVAERFRARVKAREDSYLFVRIDGFPREIFVHRSRSPDNWDNLQRESEVEVTVGFNMRGPVAASLRAL